jgi:hypothetical protein
MDEIVLHEGDRIDGKELTSPPSPQPTPEQQRAKVVEIIAQQWTNIGDQTRLAMAKARGLLKPEDEKDADKVKSVIGTIVLEGDRMRYAVDKDGLPRMATSRFGFLSFPKPKGRKKRHLTKTEQAIKSASLRIFRRLFEECAIHMERELTAKGEQYFGLPEDMLRQLGARAARLGALEVATHNRVARRHVQRQQKLSRGINRGLIAGNTAAHHVHSGGQYGG